MNVCVNRITLALLSMAVSFLSCSKKYEKTYNTAFLNLKGNIKSIREERTPHEQGTKQYWQISFDKNNLNEVIVEGNRSISKYLVFHNQKGSLEHIHVSSHSATAFKNVMAEKPEVKPEDFESLFSLPLILQYFFVDTIYYNAQHDISRLLVTSGPDAPVKEYKIDYIYDSQKNWTTQNIYNDNKLYQSNERVIIYDRQITSGEINAWDQKTDSLFQKTRDIYNIIARIDSSISENKEEQKRLHKLISVHQQLTEDQSSYSKLLNVQFKKQYGSDNLTPELSTVHQKLGLLEKICFEEEHFMKEVGMTLSLLVSGSKLTNDPQAPPGYKQAQVYSHDMTARLAKSKSDYEEL